MDNYTSDSSDSDNSNKILDFSYMQLDPDTIDLNLETFEQDDKKSTHEIDTIILLHNELKTLPNHLCRFSNLKVLDVSSNGLTMLPDIFQYCSLSVLLAKNNNLNNESLPKSFSNCLTLRELNLSGNQLTAFPEQVLDCINLRYLYLGGNKITTISKNVWKLTSLHVLSMGGNLLTEVPSSVGQLKVLHALVLCDNHIEKIPAEIAKLKHLKSLLLHKNKLKTLPQEIVTLKNLTELSLRENPLVVRFVTSMLHNPASLLELSARIVKIYDIAIQEGDIPELLVSYLNSAHHCVNPNCKGVFFDDRVEHVKFVDFCGKYRIPLLQYLCSSKCIVEGDVRVQPSRSYLMQKVLLG